MPFASILVADSLTQPNFERSERAFKELRAGAVPASRRVYKHIPTCWNEHPRQDYMPLSWLAAIEETEEEHECREEAELQVEEHILEEKVEEDVMEPALQEEESLVVEQAQENEGLKQEEENSVMGEIASDKDSIQLPVISGWFK